MTIMYWYLLIGLVHFIAMSTYVGRKYSRKHGCSILDGITRLIQPKGFPMVSNIIVALIAILSWPIVFAIYITGRAEEATDQAIKQMEKIEGIE